MDKIEKSTLYNIHCETGHRSVIFASILKSRGYHNITNIRGGYEEISKTSIAKKHT